MSLTTFEDLSVEALTEVAKEKFEEAVWATEKALAKQLEFGRVMSIVKSKLPHGQWSNWVLETFEDKLSLRSIQCHMKAANAIAQNPALLDCADSLDSILELTAVPKKPGVVVTKPAADPAEAKDVIDVDSKPVEPKQKPSSNPRSDAAPRNSKPAAPEFDLGSSLDEHRSAILEMAGDYAAAKQTKHFIVMLRKVAADLEVATP
jgi:hypothetical protein